MMNPSDQDDSNRPTAREQRYARRELERDNANQQDSVQRDRTSFRIGAFGRSTTGRGGGPAQQTTGGFGRGGVFSTARMNPTRTDTPDDPIPDLVPDVRTENNQDVQIPRPDQRAAHTHAGTSRTGEPERIPVPLDLPPETPSNQGIPMER